MTQTVQPDGISSLLGALCRFQHARMHGLLHALGIYRGQYGVLRALWQEDGLTQTELTERGHVRAATVSKTTQRMEKAGLVARRRDAADQRISRVYLTERGRELQADVEGATRQLQKDVLQGFTLEERVLLRRFLIQMRDNLAEAAGRGEEPARGHRDSRREGGEVHGHRGGCQHA